MKRNRDARDAFFYPLGYPVSTYFRPCAGDPLIVKSNFSHPRVLAALGAASCVVLGVSDASAQTKTTTFDKSSILVLSTATKSSAVTTRGLRVMKDYKNVGWSKVALAPGTDVTSTIASLRKQGIQAEPNYIQKFFKAPNDPQYATQWAWEKISAPQAWDVTTGGTEIAGGGDVVVAILDSGITPSHPDLKANLYVNKGEIPNNGKDDDGNGLVDDVNGYDFAQDNGVPDDGNQHGTHVAGTIGAAGNNKVGVTGVNWRVKLLSCRVGSDEGAIYTSAVISALDYLVSLKNAGVNIRVANHSYGGYQFSQAEFAAFQRASNAGILNVCAAGNDDINNDALAAYPASFRIPGLISVAASDQNDMPADFTNVGKRSVALAAPGVDILSTLPPGHQPDGSLYGTLSGTSMASPHVAGALALLLAQTPTLSMQEAQTRLFASVDKLPQWGKLVSTGGRLNLAKLLAGNSYAVSGRVLRANGTPVAGVTVSISGTTKTTTTDTNGFYRFSALAVGRYTVSAKLSGFNIAPSAGSNGSITFAGSAYSLTQNFLATSVATNYLVSGTAYNTYGKVQAGVEIFVNNSTQAAAVTNAQGKYVIDDLIQGNYTLTAKYRGLVVTSANRPSVAVRLPALSGASLPNSVIDWQVPSVDVVSPTINLTTPKDGQNYPAEKLKAIVGNAFDNDQLAALEFTLYQYDDNDDTSYMPYNWTTGTFDGNNMGLPKVVTVNKVSTPINVPLTNLTPGYYYLFVVARDRSGNSSYAVSQFTVTSTTQISPDPASYPRFTFTTPSENSAVKSGTAFTARGTATAISGVQTLNFYLQWIDDRGANLGYYDWFTKSWVSSLNNTTTVTQRINGGTTVQWSLPMPALPKGRFVLHAYGVALDGSQPPADGSLDDNVSFRTNTSTTSTAALSKSGS